MHHDIIDTENPQNYEHQPKRYLCRHIFTDGHRCGSICLRGEHFCYYHHTTRRPAANPRERRSRRTTFEIPIPEDRSAIQATIGMVLQRIAANDIDPRRASLLLYGLSIATSNLPKAPAQSRNSRNPAEPEQVEEITTHPDLGTLAPKSEFNPPEERLSLAGRLIAELRRKPCACQQDPDPDQEPPSQPTILPTLTAAEAHTEPNSSHPTSHVRQLTPKTRGHNQRSETRRTHCHPRNERATLFELSIDSRAAELYSYLASNKLRSGSL